MAGGVAEQLLDVSVGARQAISAIGMVRLAAGAVQQRTHLGCEAQARGVAAGVAEGRVVQCGPGTVGIAQLGAVTGPFA